MTDSFGIRKMTGLVTPTLTSINPSSSSPGTTVAVTLLGNEFAPGASIAVDGTGVTVSWINVTGLGVILANFDIDPGAVIGSGHNVTVTTSAGTSSSVVFRVQ